MGRPMHYMRSLYVCNDVCKQSKERDHVVSCVGKFVVVHLQQINLRFIFTFSWMGNVENVETVAFDVNVRSLTNRENIYIY